LDKLTSREQSSPRSPSAKRRPGRPSLSDEQLLDRALDLFLEHGFEGTSIEAITSAAGMAKKTVYARYGDKKSLFIAALRRAIEQWIVPLERLREVEADDLEETLRNISRILMSNIMTPAGLRLLRITNAESNRMPEIGAYTYKIGTGQTIDYLADLFNRRLGPNRLVEWREAALAFLNLVISGPPTQTVWGVVFDERSIERHIEFSVRLFVFGLMSNGGEDAVGVTTSEGANALVRELRSENQVLRKLLVDALLANATASLRGAAKHPDGSAETIHEEGLQGLPPPVT
jgi:TetR/AcrR family transcriptional regulator, mexJK operon transcriptional repressor